MSKSNTDFEGWLDDALRRNGFLFPNTDKQMDEFIKKINNAMKREIKFRGKRLDTGKWVYGDLHQFDRRPDKAIWPIDEDDWIEVDPATVGQYTGLKDKNGREIYEDDIFEHRGIFGCVVWDSQLLQFQCAWENFGFKTAGDISYLRNMGAVVLGNIHDNPELLKK